MPQSTEDTHMIHIALKKGSQEALAAGSCTVELRFSEADYCWASCQAGGRMVKMACNAAACHGIHNCMANDQHALDNIQRQHSCDVESPLTVKFVTHGL